MNNFQIENLIDEFINRMRLQIPWLEVVIKHDKIDNDYLIQHNYKNWKDIEFRLLKIELMDVIFKSNDIYNVCVAYSSDVKSTVNYDSYNFKLSGVDNIDVWSESNFQIAA